MGWIHLISVSMPLHLPVDSRFGNPSRRGWGWVFGIARKYHPKWKVSRFHSSTQRFKLDEGSWRCLPLCFVEKVPEGWGCPKSLKIEYSQRTGEHWFFSAFQKHSNEKSSSKVNSWSLFLHEKVEDFNFNLFWRSTPASPVSNSRDL